VLEALEDRDLLAQSWIGAVDPGTETWYLRHNANPGAADAGSFAYGAPGWTPVSGDWNGDGVSTIGVLDPTTETWYLRNDNSAGAPDVTPFQYGAPGWIPVMGDWTHSGHTGIGVVDPSTATWYLKNTAGPGAADFVFRYGEPGWLPVTGVWAGAGPQEWDWLSPTGQPTGIGMIDPATMTWYLRSVASAGATDVVAPFAYGAPGWTPVVGDWDGNGYSDIGVVDSGSGTWYLPNEVTPGPFAVFAYGAAGWTPLALGMNPHPGPGGGGSGGVGGGGGGTTGTAPVISLSSSALVLTSSADGKSASGQLTITNSGPAGSVLSYQVAGSVPVPTSAHPASGASWQVNAVPSTGQLPGGYSQTVQISVTGLNAYSFDTAVGSLVVSDPSGAAAGQQIPVTVYGDFHNSGGNNGGGNNGGNPSSSQATFTGDIGFSFAAYSSGTFVNQTTADGTLTLQMKRYATDNLWHVDSATATLKQPAPFEVQNVFGNYDTINMTGTYQHIPGAVDPQSGLASLNNGAQLTFGLIQQGVPIPVTIELIVTGTFANGQFVGGVVNPSYDDVINEGSPNYSFGDGVTYQVQIPVSGRPGGVQLNQV
jgi:hypothetical protein